MPRVGVDLIAVGECRRTVVAQTQLIRLVPTLVGIGIGVASQKFGLRGPRRLGNRRNDPGLDMWRTTFPALSITSRVMVPVG